MAEPTAPPAGPRESAEPSFPAIGRPIPDDLLEKNRSAFTEVFLSHDGHPARTPIIFHHIQKTAGTALRLFIRSSLPPAERRVALLTRQPRKVMLEWHRSWYDALSDSDRSRMSCVMSHTANFLLPSLDRPAYAITIVREAVDRTISQYFTLRKPGRAPRKLVDIDHESLDSAVRDIYSRLEGRTLAEVGDRPGLISFSNWQSRSLLAPHYDTNELRFTPGPPADADLWRERLFTLVDETYIVGVQERFSEFVDWLARELGCEPWVPRAKVSKARVAPAQVSAPTRESVRAFNWLDAELHQRAVARFGR